jgi:dipeptidyl aminopeptidase/acylaminoacyl peptidase
MNALNEGHGYRKKENRDIYQQATVQFFQEHLVGE